MKKKTKIHQLNHKLYAKLDALPEQTEKELCDIMFKHMEEMIKRVRNNLKYTEPLRIIGHGPFKI